MRKRIPDHFLSALIGGVVGAAVVLFATVQKSAFEETVYAQDERQDVLPPPNGKFKVLEVEKLIISEEATLRNKDGDTGVIIKDGSVLAENIILAKKMIGKQINGHAVVANRLFATPDDIMSMPMEQWRFFAEIGASNEAGGEVVVRSVNGAAVVGGPTTDGAFLRTGFDPEGTPQVLGIRNSDRSTMPINLEISESQKKMLH